MPVPLVAQAGTIVGAIGDIFSSGSPRYGGGDGPLISTVQGFLNRVVQGDITVIREMDAARKTAERGRSQWQQVWTNELPRVPLTQSQYVLVKQLDPTLPVVLRAVGMPATPAGPWAGPPVAQQADPQGAEPPPGTPLSNDGGFWLLGVIVLLFFFAARKGG